LGTASRHALTTTQIAGAGLDVMTEEPPAANRALFGLDTVTFTPDTAGPTTGPTWEAG